MLKTRTIDCISRITLLMLSLRCRTSYFAMLLLFPLFSSAFSQIRINEFMAANINANFNSSFNYVDWVELYNESDYSINLNGYSLTDDSSDPRKFVIDGNIFIHGRSYRVISLDKEDQIISETNTVHTNFSLDSDGEFIGIYAPSGAVVDSLSFGQQAGNISYGRLPNFSNVWRYFVEPTPKAANTGAYLMHSLTAGEAQFTVDPGFYSGSVTVALTSTGAVDEMRYTLDGEYPTTSSTLYSEPITLSETTVIRVACFADDRHPGPVLSGTYFIDIPAPNLPVVSLSTDIDNFEHGEYGIYVDGENGLTNPYCSPDKAVNWLQDWERPVNFEFFTIEGEQEISQLVGTKVYGGCSRSAPIRSLSIISRKDYGKKGLNNTFFTDKNVDEFKSLVLRNSGNDARASFLRDGFMQTLIKDRMDIDYQAYQPVLVYLNGEYFGLLNLREKMVEHYVESNHGIDSDSIDVLDSGGSVIHGNSEAFDQLIDYLENHNLSNPEAFNYVASQLDIDEYLNYFMLNIYYGNSDWPYNNYKIWRERKEGGKWRAMVYDTDLGFGLDYASGNSLQETLDAGFSSVIFRALLENDSCKNEFFQRFAAHINTTWNPDRVIPVLDSLASLIAPHIPTQVEKWYRPYSESEWDEAVNEVMPTFAQSRVGEAQGWLGSYLGIDRMYRLNVDINSAGSGNVLVCEVEVPEAYSGDHFAYTPLRLAAKPKPGYEFSGWIGDYVSDEEEIWVDMNSNISVTATFNPTAPVTGLFINEFLSSNTSGEADEYGEFDDWIEIYNSNDFPVNLAGIFISDSAGFPTQYKIPFGDSENTSIPANGYILLWADKDPEQGSLHLPFKLRKSGEMILLSQQLGEGFRIIDSITFSGQISDVTYGRSPQDNKLWRFLIPTPRAVNEEKILENIFINEFMASNQSVLEDGPDEYDDWIELYNDNDYPVDIGGVFLSDDSNNRSKFMITTAFPDSTTIAAKDYLLLWVDDSIEQGLFHLNFKLSGAGEQILLSQPNGVDILDSVTYPELISDAPYGRIQDGSGPFSYMLATPGASNTQPSFSGLYINEFMASNQSVLEDNYGEFDDWIELYNDNEYPVNIGGLFLSDDFGNKSKSRISTAYPDSTTIPSKGHILIWADDSVEQGILHAGFKLSAKGEQVILSSPTANDILDSVSFESIGNDVAFGRLKDGDQQLGILKATPGAPNETGSVENIFINEVMASNSHSYTDEYGEYDDWIELYNANDFAVDIGGMFITDDYGVDRGYNIPTSAPELTEIDAKGFLLIWADNTTEQGILHTDFGISRKGEKIVLLQPDGVTVADSIRFGKQYPDITTGRITEGSKDITFMIPSPGEANKTTNYEGIIISEVMASDHTGIMDEHGQYEDWIELYNSGTYAIDIALMMLTDSLAYLDSYPIPGGNADSTTIQPGEYLVLWADNQPEQGVLHLGFGLREGGEEVGLYSSDGKLLDSLSYPNQFNNFSYSKLENNLWIPLPPTPGEKNEVPTIENIYINEYMSDNENRLMDEFGEYDDWIELYNDNSFPVNLAGLYLSDSLGQPNMYRISSKNPENTLLPAKGYRLIWADNDDEQGALHTNFKLSRSGGDIVLSGYDYHQSIDSKEYSKQYSNFASARLKDRGRWMDMPPTPETSNVLPDNSQIFINEIMTSNVNTHSDNYGEFDDWIEIYNGGSEAVDLGGLFISDSIGNREPFRISSRYPDSTTIQPNQYLLVWADDSEEQGILHADFQLRREGEQVLLYNYNRKTIIDSISYSKVPKNQSFGRFSDGSYPWKEMNFPTPLEQNFGKITHPTQVDVNALNFEVYPNPVSDNLKIAMEIGVTTKVTLRVFDHIGNLVAIPIESYYYPGEHEFLWNLTSARGNKLKTGVYFYVFETKRMRVSEKLVIIGND